MKLTNKKIGISLITLIIIIILIFILAGVVILSLSNNNPLEMAYDAVRINNEASVKQDVRLALVTLQGEYYTGKCLEPGNVVTFPQYVRDKLENGGIDTGNGIIKFSGDENKDNEVIYEGKTGIVGLGTFDDLTGNIDITEVNTPNIPKKHYIFFEQTKITKNFDDGTFIVPINNEYGLELTYTSSNEAVATVNPNTGEVTMVGLGEVIITATVKDTGEVASYELNITENSMEYEVLAYHNEYDGTPHGVSIVVTKPSEYTVRYGLEEGVYDLEESPTIQTTGTMTIYYEITAYGYETIYGRETIVIEKANAIIEFAKSSISKKVGNDNFINSLNNTGDGVVSYYSSNAQIAEVNESTGEVTILSAGTITVTAIVQDGENYEYPEKTITYTIDITKNESYINFDSFDGSVVNKYVGDSNYTTEVTMTGDGKVTYTSSNEEVATVDPQTGEVTILSAGDTVITATVDDTNASVYDEKTASYTLRVSKNAASISFDSLSETKTYGDASFTKTVTKTGDGTVTYSSSNSEVATVNSSSRRSNYNRCWNFKYNCYSSG